MRCPKCRQNIEPSQFWPIEIADVADDIRSLPQQMQEDLIAWWNEARRSRHGPRCTWTRAAWRMSARRICQIHAVDKLTAEAMVEGGIEHGWMALKIDYVSEPRKLGTTGSVGSTRDGAMKTAINLWNSH